MAVPSPSLLRHIRRLVPRPISELVPDAMLLDQFIRRKDEDAFAALVARHGPMVFGVCRRILHNTHEAEDAAQATFLVLARKASTIRRAETLAAWLHWTAHHLALKCLRAETRRRERETRGVFTAVTVSPPDPLDELSARELLAILDEELRCLPERYRLPLILCYLEGRTHEEAARQLGWTAGSVKGRLKRGRAKLQERLIKRGLALSAVPLVLLATPPAKFLASTLRLAASEGTMTAEVMALAEEGMRSIAVTKSKIIAALLLFVGVAAAGFGSIAHRMLAAEQNAEPAKVAAPAVAKVKESARTDRYGDPLPPGVLARLGTTRLRRGSEVYSLPERDAFLSVERGQNRLSACKWRTSTGQRLRRWEFPMERVSVTVSSDGKTLAVSGVDTRSGKSCVRLWDLASGMETGELSGAGIAEGMAFAPDGKRIATAGVDQTLRLWDTKSGTELHRFEGTTDLWWTLAFSPDGKILASASFRRQTVHLWDTATGRELRALGDGPGLRSTVAFSPDGKTLATTTGDEKNKTVRLWDVTAGKEIRQFPTESGCYSLAFSPDGKVLAGGGMPGPLRPITTTSPIYLWDVSGGQEICRLPGHVFTVMSLAFSADGKRLVSGSSSSVMKVWEVATGKEAVPMAEHESWVMSAAFSPDGRLVASGSLDGTIRLWEPATGKLVRIIEGTLRPQVLHLAFSPDGRTLLSDRQDGFLHSWDVATGRTLHPLKVDKNDNKFFSFVLSPDGRTLAIWRQDGMVRLLDADGGAEKRRWTGCLSDWAYLCFSPDGGKLACLSASYRGGGTVLQLWDVATGAEKQKWPVAERGPLVFSPDGQTLMGASGDNFLRVGQTERAFHAWDVATGEDRPFMVAQHDRVESMAISPDGRMLAWGDSEGTITLWERAAGQVRRRLKGHLARVCTLDFSPDGRTLASGGSDTSVLIWDVTGRPSSGRSEERRVEPLWADLAHKDASKAFDAVGLLTASPEQAVPTLKDKLKAAPAAAERKQVARLLADLDSERFEVRQKAMEELKQLGERSEPALEEALKDKLSLETRKRVEELLEGVRATATDPQRLRELRAVEVLEHIGTPEAQQVLHTLADGAPTARLTREARASLQRIVPHR